MSTYALDPLVAAGLARVGQTLRGKWRLERLIGVGGMSAVYEAVHANGQRAAVKVLTADWVPQARKRERASYESYVANAVGHPGVVRVFDDDVAEDGSVYIVMELLEGETLEERKRRAGGWLPFDRATPIFEALLDTVGSAHERDIIHRDIKPENVFLTHADAVKVLDFGLAYSGEDDDGADAWCGTPGFLSPEQARGCLSDLDVRSDVWAIGATMYTVLAGRLVHGGETAADLVHAAATREAPSIADAGLDLPPRLVEVVDRALAFDRDDRWANAREMRDALRAATVVKSGPRLVQAPRRLEPGPLCRSSTRVYRLDAMRCGQGGCDSPERPRKIRCTICPICPLEVKKKSEPMR